MAEEIKKEKSTVDVMESSDGEIMEIETEILERLMIELTVVKKSILLMTYQDGFSIKDILRLTPSVESAVKMKSKRTKSKLLKLYEKR